MGAYDLLREIGKTQFISMVGRNRKEFLEKYVARTYRILRYYWERGWGRVFEIRNFKCEVLLVIMIHW